MRLILFVFTLAIMCSCGVERNTDTVLQNDSVRTVTEQTGEEPTPSATPESVKYPGVTIDEVFPISAHFSLIDDDGREPEMNVDAAGYSIKIKDYVPRTLWKDGKRIFDFKRREPGGYWGTLVGVSHLTGPKKTEIYTVISGPAAVCCTNYSIVDVSTPQPKNIYHSEDFGSFRNPMEIFDADGDGVYELLQFDSCFRYFMDDCGSCSPEPRAYFKYDRVREQYLPAKGIRQDFVNEDMARTAKWIDDKFQEFQQTGDLTTKLDLHRSVLSYVVDLFHIGEERKAWEIFDKYGDDADGKIRREMRKRLSQCKFYQALHKQSEPVRNK
jgi:hypothetical protein